MLHDFFLAYALTLPRNNYRFGSLSPLGMYAPYNDDIGNFWVAVDSPFYLSRVNVLSPAKYHVIFSSQNIKVPFLIHLTKIPRKNPVPPEFLGLLFRPVPISGSSRGLPSDHYFPNLSCLHRVAILINNFCLNQYRWLSHTFTCLAYCGVISAGRWPVKAGGPGLRQSIPTYVYDAPVNKRPFQFCRLRFTAPIHRSQGAHVVLPVINLKQHF